MYIELVGLLRSADRDQPGTLGYEEFGWGHSRPPAAAEPLHQRLGELGAAVAVEADALGRLGPGILDRDGELALRLDSERL